MDGNVFRKSYSHDIKRKTNISEFFFNAVTAIFLKPFPISIGIEIYSTYNLRLFWFESKEGENEEKRRLTLILYKNV